MKKEDLIKKIQERNAIKQQAEVKTETPQPTGEKAQMQSFTIVWHEGTGEFDGKTVTTWKEANKMMNKIYFNHHGAGYTKVKVNVKWNNGAEITDRCDCSDSQGDFCANRETIGQYLSRQNSVMYGSILQIGDRINLSFEDQENHAGPTTEIKSNLSETPELLRQLLGIVETIEESNDSSKVALIKASEQVEKAKAYICYLQAILPILEAKTNAMIEAAHQPKKIYTNIEKPENNSLN